MCEFCEDTEPQNTWSEKMQDSEKVNVPLLLQELRRLTITPEKWNQGMWALSDVKPNGEKPKRGGACGSFGCLAGNTVINQGYELDWFEDELYSGDHEEYRAVWIANDVIMNPDSPALEDFRTEPINRVAQEELGLNGQQAAALFNGDNDLEMMWGYAYTVSGGVITEDDYAKAVNERDVGYLASASVE